MGKRLPSTCDRPERPGLTLLELMLALALSALIFVAVGMALDLNVRKQHARRTNVEEAQLARAILRTIGDDLRGAVQITQESDSLDGLSSNPLTAAIGGDADTSGESTPPSGGGGSGTTGGGGASEDTTGTGDADETGEDIASSVVPPPKLGLYGNATQLQVDVSRLPRPDQYNPMLGAQASNQQLPLDLPSDVKTVAYYIQPGGLTQDNAVSLTRQTDLVSGGLIRRELDRAVTALAAQGGDANILQQSAEVIAPEVTSILFEYFDGLTWLEEWDSSVMEGLPQAVRVVVTVRPRDEEMRTPIIGGAAPQTTVQQGHLVYWLVIKLPLANPPISAEDDGLGSVGL